VASDVHIVFFARPMSLELQLVLSEKKALAKGLKYAEEQPALAHRVVTELGEEWSLRIQQMQVDDESGEAANYQDVYKDSVVNLNEETAVTIFNKAAYLNSEEKWVTPLYVSRRFNAEQISVMRLEVLDVVGKEIEKLIPLVQFLRGRKAAKKTKKTKPKKKRAKKKTAPTASSTITSSDIDPEKGFTFVTAVKPLCFRKGFVNMTPQHWDFFKINSRTETRDVTVYYDGVYDKDSAVWHIQSNGMARLVFSRSVHRWFKDNFDNDDQIHLAVKRLDGAEIQISLKAVE